eukprot:1008313-Pyramimonas_sp.AAC.1
MAALSPPKRTLHYLQNRQGDSKGLAYYDLHDDYMLARIMLAHIQGYRLVGLDAPGNMWGD